MVKISLALNFCQVCSEHRLQPSTVLIGQLGSAQLFNRTSSWLVEVVTVVTSSSCSSSGGSSRTSSSCRGQGQFNMERRRKEGGEEAKERWQLLLLEGAGRTAPKRQNLLVIHQPIRRDVRGKQWSCWRRGILSTSSLNLSVCHLSVCPICLSVTRLFVCHLSFN